MVDQVKVLIAERNGVELFDKEEFDLAPYILSVETDHHSGWQNIIEGQEVEVYEKKQMRISGPFILCGIIILIGSLVID